MSLLYEALRKKQKAETRLSLPDRDKGRAAGGGSKPVLVAVVAVAVLAAGGYLFYQYMEGISSGPVLVASPSVTVKAPAVPEPTVVAGSPAAIPATGGPVAALEKKEEAPSPSGPAAAAAPGRSAAGAELAASAPRQLAWSGKVAVQDEQPPARPAAKVKKLGKGNSGKAAGNPAAEAYMQKAQDFHRRDEPGGAIPLYKEVLVRAPQHSDAHLNLAAAYLEESRYDEATGVLEEMRKQTGDSAALLVNLAIAALGKKEPDRALALLDRAAVLPAAPEFSILLHRGVAFSMKNEAGKAIEAYEQAFARRPDDPTLLFNRAVAFDKAQRYENAMAAYKDFLRTNSELARRQKKVVEERLRLLQLAHP